LLTGLLIADVASKAAVDLAPLYVLPPVWLAWKSGWKVATLAVTVVLCAFGLLESRSPLDTVICGMATAILAAVTCVGRANWLQEKSIAATDFLTGAATPRAFYIALNREIGRCKRTHEPLSLAFFDIDQFKRVNDIYGHKRGDQLLRVFASTIAAFTRSFDYLGRLGGDEFVLLLPGADEDAANKAVERLLLRLRENLKVAWWPTTVSAGVVTTFTPQNDGTELVYQADHLLYLAKSRGGNQAAYGGR
jgi:diguanylate cyclase (GGDEF)-like protein